MSKPKVVIVDSEICNLFNVRRAFAAVGADLVVTRAKADILGAGRVVLPGVGAFGAGMGALERHDLIESVREYVRTGKALLGICLGMQLLLGESEEHGRWPGLGIIRGRVRALRQAAAGQPAYKIPHIGWSAIEPAADRTWAGTVLDGVPVGSHMYFVHSFVVAPEDPRCVLAETAYGADRFCSVLNHENVSACQFHPERSGEAGLRLLQQFATSGVLAAR